MRREWRRALSNRCPPRRGRGHGGGDSRWTVPPATVDVVREATHGARDVSALRLRVPAMTCRRCVRTVTARLRDVPGVATIEASASERTVAVAGTMSAREVLSALDECGYPGRLLS